MAEADLDGVLLGEAVRWLIMEHHFARINQRYEELHLDPAEWESYRAGLRRFDGPAVE